MILRLPAQKIAVKNIFGGLYEQNGPIPSHFHLSMGGTLRAAFV